VLTFDAVGMCARWESPPLILQKAEEGLAALKAHTGAVSWEQSMAFTIGLRSREQLGKLCELDALGTAWLADSVDRGDLFAETMARQACAMASIAAGDIARARSFAQTSIQRWSQSAFTVQHYYAIRYEVQCDLLEGNAQRARNRIRDSWSSIKAAQLLRNPISRPEILLLRGLVELAAASQAGKARCAGAKDMGSQLKREQNPVSQVHAELLEIAGQSIGEVSTRAAVALRDVAEKYRSLGLSLQALCVEKALAFAQDDAQADERIAEVLRASGVHEPHRYVYVHVPRFGHRWPAIVHATRSS
jgi:eukaryotic-like serine/threonine-protein kinase